MGDRIDDNIWEGAEDINLNQDILHSDDEIDSDYELDYNNLQENDIPYVNNEDLKKNNKKRKLTELKEKKKKIIHANNNDNENEISNDIKQLSAKEMALTIVSHRRNIPNESSKKDDLVFMESDFFYPEFIHSHTESKTKKICPYVRAMATGLESYKKIVFHKSNDIKDYGHPTILIICMSAIRATEIIKSISLKLHGCKIAKLFAKHIKLNEQVELLSKDYYPIAIGTPKRLSQLIEAKALYLNKTKLILVDISQDIKKFNILTLNDVKVEFYKLLDEFILKEKKHMKLALLK